MQHITSRENAFYKRAKSLQTSKGRRESGLYAVEGAKMIQEALKSDQRIDSAAVDASQAERFAHVLTALKEAGAVVYSMPSAMMEGICATEEPQGIIALLHTRPSVLPGRLESLGEKVLLLDGVQDPGNLGTILRTASAFGLSAVLLGPGCASQENPKVIRAAMGATFRLPVFESADPVGLLEQLGGLGYQRIAGDLNGQPQRPAVSGPCVLVIGSEGRGITSGTRGRCDTLWKLPMPGEAESLNAAVAAGVMMYELFVC
jgi:RNA methyltransferase, TrmH family